MIKCTFLETHTHLVPMFLMNWDDNLKSIPIKHSLIMPYTMFCWKFLAHLLMDLNQII